MGTRRGLIAVAVFCVFIGTSSIVLGQSFSNNSEPDTFGPNLFGCFAATPDPFPTESTDISIFQTFSICFDPYDIEEQIEVTSLDIGVWSFPGSDDEVEIWARLWVDESGGAPTLDDRPGEVGDDPPADNLLGEQMFVLDGLLDGVTVNLEFDDAILVPCDSILVVEIFHARQSGDTDGDGVWDEDGDAFVMGNNEEDEETESYVYRDPCGDTEIIAADLIFSPDPAHFLITVIYESTGEFCDCLPPDVDCQDPTEGGLAYLFKDAMSYISEPDGVITSAIALVDTITVDGVDEDVVDLDVRIDITHPFSGDIVLELESDIGTSVTLYDGLAGAAPDIDCTFDDEGREHGVPFFTGDRIAPVGPGVLSDFDDEAIDGDWVLTVSDTDPIDDGTLNGWTLNFNFPVGIPDDDASGTDLVLTVPDTLVEILDLDIGFDLFHEMPSDLVIEIESPDGTSVVIVDGDLSDDDDLVVERVSDDDGVCDGGYGTVVTTAPGSLGDYDGAVIAGDWTLTVIDGAMTNVGDIDSWSLLVAPAPCEGPTGLVANDSCETDEVLLNWDNPDTATYASIDIMRDGVLLGEMDGDATSYIDSDVDSGPHTYTIIGDCDPGRAGATVAMIHVSCCPVEDVAMESECDTGDVSVSWNNPDGVFYEGINVFRNDVLVAELDGDAESYVDLDVENGFQEYTVEATCEDPLGANTTSAVFLHAVHTDELHLLWGPAENGVGAWDSAQVIFDTLDELGESVLWIPALDYPCMPAPDEYESLWVSLGTFPNNHALTLGEGTILAELVTGDVGLDDSADYDPIPLYLESGDTWGGFDIETDFADYDGNEQAVDDGDDSFVSMDGLSYRDVDMSDFVGIGYAQDQAGFDWTDHLVPTGSTVGTDVDLGGPFAGSIWEDDGTGGALDDYGTGTVYQAVYDIGGEEVANRIITQSFEIAGFDDDITEVITRYLAAMTPSVPPIADFEVDVTSGTAPLSVTFTDLSTDPKTWSWDFGDGNTSEEQSPVHEYDTDGVYDVTLTVRNGGGSDVLLRKGYIEVVPDVVPRFIRGDVDNNGGFSALLDGLYLLEYNFQSGDVPPCLEAADIDGDNSISLLLDALYGFQYAFSGGLAPPDPGPDECGPDDDDAGLGCETMSDACD